MPFLSRRQQRWAFANKKPFAKRWAKETPSFAALPESKDAGTTAGASLSGPGGLLATPGMGGGLRKRFKAALKATRITGNLYRGETGQFQAGGADTGTPAKQPPAASSTATRRTRTPAKTEQERAETRQGKQRERDDARVTQRAQNRAEVLRSLNIAPDGAEALAALRNGQQPDPAAIARAGFVDAGLVEQSPDGSYRMTPAGRAVLSAADAGDRGRAGDTISGGRDRVGARRQRQQAAAERKQQPPKVTAGGGGGKEKPKPDVAKRMRRINTRIAKMRKRRGLPVAQTTKAQTAQDRAMFAKMGGGGKGGGGSAGGGGAAWPKGPDGKRHPSAAQVDAMQAKLDTRRDALEKNPPKDRTRMLRERSDIKRREFDAKEHKERATHALDKMDHQLRNKRREIINRQRRASPGTQELRDLGQYLNQIDDAINETKRKRRLIEMAGKSFTTKAQTAEDRAMFAKMGGSSSGGGGGGSAGGGASKLWPKGPSGKRTPQAAAASQGEQTNTQKAERAVTDAEKGQVFGGMLRRDQDAGTYEARAEFADKTHTDDYTSKTLPVSSLIAETTSFQPDRVARFMSESTIRKGDAPTVMQYDGKNYLMDGHHRVLSRVALGENSVPVRVYTVTGKTPPKSKSFTVYKSHDGTPRWLARTTTAYRDRDREIIAIKALDADSQRMTAAGQFGPLRMWHLGRPDPLDASAPWGPGVDVGDCDFSMQVGRTRVESGTFKSHALAQRIAATADQYELSPGFFHPADQPDGAGVFTTIRTFERSLVPIKYGRASNLFTGLTVKEQRMDPQEENRRLKAVISQLGLDQQAADALTSGLIQADKSAATQGIAYKSDDGDQTIVINGITYKAEQPEIVDEPPPDVVINGVTYKAVPPFLADAEDEEEKADFGEGEAVGEELADMGGMDDGALIAAIADAVVAKIAPMFGDMKISEFKNLMSGMATKSAGDQAEIAALKAEQAKLAQRLAQLTGDQPVAPSDIEAALKSTGPTSPNAMPAPTTAVQSIAMQTLPDLYKAAPDGSWNGWQATQIPPSTS
jgi:hypothetical protein